MSFKNNHININKSNYEEYFVLYADNELTPEEKTAVQDFVAQNPALEVELNLLLSTKIPIENVGLPDKEALFAQAMEQHINEADLLLFIDDELSSNEKEEVEKKLTAQPNLQRQLQLLLKAKLNKQDKIIYPFKQQLYRRSSTYYLSAPAFFRVAAAVIVLLIGSILFIHTKDTPPNASPAKIAVKPTPENTTERSMAVNKSHLPEAAIAKTEIKPKQRVTKKLTAPTPQQVNAPKQSIALLPIGNNKDDEINDEVAIKVPVINDKAEAVALLKQEKKDKKIIDKDVTIDSNEAYNLTEATNKKAPQFAAFSKNESNNKATLKVLLRKATRYIERTTNINTTTEDDEFLIGAFAVKL